MEGLAAGKHNRGKVHPKGFQNCQLGGQVGQVDSLASLQVGLGPWEGGEGASLEVGHLADPEVGHLVALEGGHLVGLGVYHLEDPKGGYLEVQVVGSYHLGWWEAAPEEGGRLDWHGSLGQNKIPG